MSSCLPVFEEKKTRSERRVEFRVLRKKIKKDLNAAKNHAK
jgi:hypothetical protein